MFECEFFCEFCDCERMFTISTKFERWQDESVDDDDLSNSELTQRVNGDYIEVHTCNTCGTSNEYL